MVEQLVVFRLADQEYAAPIEQVREVTLYRDGDFSTMEQDGMNRGKRIEAVDLAVFFDVPSSAQRERFALILEDVDRSVGFVVDDVYEVLQLPRSEIEKPQQVEGAKAEYIQGIGKKDDRRIFILAPERMLDFCT